MFSKNFIFLSCTVVFMLTSACPTTPTPNAGGARKRRDVPGSDNSYLSVTIVTTQPWNPESNKANLLSVRQLIQSYEVQHGIQYDMDILQQEAREIGGNLAVHYQLHEDCETVKQFVKDIREAYSDHIQYGLVVCLNQPLSVY